MLNLSRAPKFEAEKFLIVSRVPEWAETFDVEVSEIERQIGYAVGWAINNPKKAPKKNIMRYLYNWLLIAQRKGSLIKTVVKPKPKESELESDLTIEEMRDIRRRNFPQFKADPCDFKDSIDTEAL